MEEILKMLKEISAEISMPPARWFDKFNVRMVERGFAPVRPEHYWAALTGVMSAKIDFVIFKAEHYMKDKEGNNAESLSDSGGTK